MSDAYAGLRSLPFPVVASALGWDVDSFRKAKADFVGPCHIHGSKNNKNCFRYHESGNGVLYGYLGRNTDNPESNGRVTDIPKYLFPQKLPKSRFLFGADVLKAGKFGAVPLKRIYLLESPFAVMKFAAMGLPALSPFGWHVSEEQLALLSGLAKGVVVLPDRNKADECRQQAGNIARVLWVRFPPLPAGIDDPEELTLDQIRSL